MKILKNNVKYIYFILIIVWMSVIFCFSSQNATESSSVSGVFVTKIKEILVSLKIIDVSNIDIFTEQVSFVVRKLAHFTIYAVGGFLILGYLNETKVKKKFATAVIIGVLYACTDEIHQYFIPGRSMEIRDVIIDIMGIVVGSLLYNNKSNKKVN